MQTETETGTSGKSLSSKFDDGDPRQKRLGGYGYGYPVGEEPIPERTPRPRTCGNCTGYYSSTKRCYEDLSINEDSPACDEFSEVGDMDDADREEFVKMAWETARTVVKTIIRKDKKYNSAYRKVRKACLQKYGDASIPYFVHSFEKEARQGAEDDDEDAHLDRVGYELLEYICWKLDGAKA